MADPVAERLCRDLGQTVSLGILDGADVVYLLRHDPPRPIRLGIRAGFRLPAHASSMGWVLLAGLPGWQLERLVQRTRWPALTDHTETDPARLLAGIEAAGRPAMRSSIRRRGGCRRPIGTAARSGRAAGGRPQPQRPQRALRPRPGRGRPAGALARRGGGDRGAAGRRPARPLAALETGRLPVRDGQAGRRPAGGDDVDKRAAPRPAVDAGLTTSTSPSRIGRCSKGLRDLVGADADAVAGAVQMAWPNPAA
jgi:hypothetical protein